MQIFYPFPIQLFTSHFPGPDPVQCQTSDSARKKYSKKLNDKHIILETDQFRDEKVKCTENTKGHRREVAMCQIKHHWWWKVNGS